MSNTYSNEKLLGFDPPPKELKTSRQTEAGAKNDLRSPLTDIKRLTPKELAQLAKAPGFTFENRFEPAGKKIRLEDLPTPAQKELANQLAFADLRDLPVGTQAALLSAFGGKKPCQKDLLRILFAATSPELPPVFKKPESRA